MIRPGKVAAGCSGRPDQECQSQPSRSNHTPSETASSSSPGCSHILAAESESGPSSGRSDTGRNLIFRQQEAPQSHFSTSISHLLILQHLGQLLKTISPPPSQILPQGRPSLGERPTLPIWEQGDRGPPGRAAASPFIPPSPSHLGGGGSLREESFG